MWLWFSLYFCAAATENRFAYDLELFSFTDPSSFTVTVQGNKQNIYYEGASNSSYPNTNAYVDDFSTFMALSGDYFFITLTPTAKYEFVTQRGYTQKLHLTFAFDWPLNATLGRNCFCDFYYTVDGKSYTADADFVFQSIKNVNYDNVGYFEVEIPSQAGDIVFTGLKISLSVGDGTSIVQENWNFGLGKLFAMSIANSKEESPLYEGPDRENLDSYLEESEKVDQALDDVMNELETQNDVVINNISVYHQTFFAISDMFRELIVVGSWLEVLINLSISLGLIAAIVGVATSAVKKYSKKGD